MNVKLKKSFRFYTGLVYNNEFAINVYDATLHMTTVSMDTEQQNIAYDRMSYWIDQVLQDAVLIGSDSPILDAYRATGQRLIVFPQDPVDQVVGAMLYLKLNAITEDRLVITGVELSSSYGDDVVYLHYAGEEDGFLSNTGWWTDPRPFWSDTKKRKAVNKVISMDRMPEWSELGLAWEEPADQQDNTVVFEDFPKNENK